MAFFPAAFNRNPTSGWGSWGGEEEEEDEKEEEESLFVKTTVVIGDSVEFVITKVVDENVGSEVDEMEENWSAENGDSSSKTDEEVIEREEWVRWREGVFVSSVTETTKSSPSITEVTVVSEGTKGEEEEEEGNRGGGEVGRRIFFKDEIQSVIKDTHLLILSLVDE